MKKIDNELKNTIESISGKVLVIGDLGDKIEKVIKKNSNIIFCDQLSNNIKISKINNGCKKSRKVNIQKLKKRYKKNGLNYVIVDAKQIINFKNTFIMDSIYISKNGVILFMDKLNDRIIKMYKRYGSVDIIKCLDGFIISVRSNKKGNFLTNKMYYIIDYLYDFINYILDFLIV